MLLSVLLLSIFSLSGGMESGIVGGREVKLHSRPYMASLQVQRKHNCGGILIKEDYVLTSAHCWKDTTNLEVVLGAHNISQRENSQQIIQVQKYIKHPNYQKKNHSFDIMLLKLKTKAVLNHFVNITNLPKHEPSILAPVECSIAGWGMQRPGEGASNVLREVNLQLESNSYCKSKWQVYFNSKNMVCTASDGKKAFCQGDSGSPLFCNSELYGMAAYTYPNNCTFKEYPEVYMKVSAFLPWIKKNMK
ncbi:granzyme 3, tandem duplicate 4 isoform X1 [Danio rerio]|uniref:Granzyme 3, tandem duplicate 4 isoform X1 n=1 Tax=Danio rerio TaxID=7955 RepID=A0AC58GCQ8_DANRE